MVFETVMMYIAFVINWLIGIVAIYGGLFFLLFFLVIGVSPIFLFFGLLFVVWLLQLFNVGLISVWAFYLFGNWETPEQEREIPEVLLFLL